MWEELTNRRSFSLFSGEVWSPQCSGSCLIFACSGYVQKCIRCVSDVSSLVRTRGVVWCGRSGGQSRPGLERVELESDVSKLSRRDADRALLRMTLYPEPNQSIYIIFSLCRVLSSFLSAAVESIAKEIQQRRESLGSLGAFVRGHDRESEGAAAACELSCVVAIELESVTTSCLSCRRDCGAVPRRLQRRWRWAPSLCRLHRARPPHPTQCPVRSESPNSRLEQAKWRGEHNKRGVACPHLNFPASLPASLVSAPLPKGAVQTYW
jgi:hypothetical protein